MSRFYQILSLINTFLLGAIAVVLVMLVQEITKENPAQNSSTNVAIEAPTSSAPKTETTIREEPDEVVTETTVEAPKAERVVVRSSVKWNSKRFSTDFNNRRPIAEIRQDRYDPIEIGKLSVRWHPGGKAIDIDKMRETISYVIGKMPNLYNDIDFEELILETMIVETRLGAEKWSTGISKWKNYGIVQWRPASAEDTLDWLKIIRPDVHRAVMSFYDRKQDMIYNLTYNVPFSTALIAQYYWRRIPDIYAHVGSLEERAIAWKSEANSSRGLGTVNVFIKRVTAYKNALANESKEDAA